MAAALACTVAAAKHGPQVLSMAARAGRPSTSSRGATSGATRASRTRPRAWCRSTTTPIRVLYSVTSRHCLTARHA
jgi:hypothetical protein